MLILLIDARTHIFIFLNDLHRIYDIETVGSYRMAGTIGSATLVYYLMSSLLLIIIKLNGRISVFETSLVFFAFPFIIYSGSRVGLSCYLILSFVIFYQNYKLLSACCAAIASVSLFTVFSDAIGNIFFSLSEPGNFTRLQHLLWFFDTPDTITLFGHGIGSLAWSQSAAPSVHFESSLLHAAYEQGIIGVLVIYSFLTYLMLSCKSVVVKVWFLLALLHSVVAPLSLSYTYLFLLSVVLFVDRHATRRSKQCSQL